LVNKSLYAVPHKTKEWGGEHATVGYRAPTPLIYRRPLMSFAR
jgi:hypothetical protein